eukprot:gene5102-18769_t
MDTGSAAGGGAAADAFTAAFSGADGFAPLPPDERAAIDAARAAPERQRREEEGDAGC